MELRNGVIFFGNVLNEVCVHYNVRRGGHNVTCWCINTQSSIIKFAQMYPLPDPRSIIVFYSPVFINYSGVTFQGMHECTHLDIFATAYTYA